MISTFKRFRAGHQATEVIYFQTIVRLSKVRNSHFSKKQSSYCGILVTRFWLTPRKILYPIFNNSQYFFILNFIKLYLFPQLDHQNILQHLIQNRPLICKQCQEENTIKKTSNILKLGRIWPLHIRYVSSRCSNTCGTLSITKNTSRPHISNNRSIVLYHKVFL